MFCVNKGMYTRGYAMTKFCVPFLGKECFCVIVIIHVMNETCYVMVKCFYR